jgi:hypothetical protein
VTKIVIFAPKTKAAALACFAAIRERIGVAAGL